MSTLDDRIRIAERHVSEARRLVMNQRERIANGLSISPVNARELLVTLEASLEILEGQLDRLRRERSGD